MEIRAAIEESVLESIFERGWVEQSPEDFLIQCKKNLRHELKGHRPNCSEEALNKMIFQSLMKHLGDEYDINIYRLKFFPALTKQEYDV